jgi:hypothetical protein
MSAECWRHVAHGLILGFFLGVLIYHALMNWTDPLGGKDR